MISLGVATAKHRAQVTYTNKPLPPDMQLGRVRTSLQLTQLVRDENRAARMQREGVPLSSAPAASAYDPPYLMEARSTAAAFDARFVWSAPFTSVLSPGVI